MLSITDVNRLARCKPYMGTFVEVSLAGDYSDDDLIELSQQAFGAIDAVDRAMSFHSPASELSRLNKLAFQQSVEISEAMQQVLECALNLSARTQGVFDVSVAPQLVSYGLLPDHKFSEKSNGCWKDIEMCDGRVRFHQPLLLDFGGIAKGYAVDRVFDVLEADDLSIVVNAGGDMRMSHWQGEKVAVRHPANPSQLVEVSMRRQSVATSGHYFLNSSSDKISDEKIQAIVARNTGLEAATQTQLEARGDVVAFEGSVSVFADSCMMADALTKVAMLSSRPNDSVNQAGGELLMLSVEI